MKSSQGIGIDMVPHVCHLVEVSDVELHAKASVNLTFDCNCVQTPCDNIQVWVPHQLNELEMCEIYFN